MATAKKTATRKTAAKKTVSKAGTSSPKAKRAKPAPASTSAKEAAPQDAAVEAFIAKLESSQQDLVRALASLIAAEAPKASAYVKWGHPLWDQAGPFVLVKPAKAHVTVGFWRGGQMRDAENLLEGEGTGMKYVRIPSGQQPPTGLAGLVREAVALNEKHGDPLKR
ncbi:DUF1801 domain-containing protein [Myxococcus stipitatus]|uniref:DUF1801 domain-containing protein n=1 Tax=Myxococcus stipitatus TaxID=83455 RepID=UPI0030CABF93